MDINTIMAVVSALLAVSEGLSLIPRFKSNGVFQVVINILRWLATKPKEEREEHDEL